MPISRSFVPATILASLVVCGCASGPRKFAVLPPTLPSSRSPAPQTAERKAEIGTSAAAASKGWKLTGAEAITPLQSGPSNIIGPSHSVSLAFDDAPLAAVTDAVVGGIMNRPYRIDNELSTAKVTLRVAGRYSEGDLMSLFAQALRPAGAAVTPESGRSIAVVPVAKAPALVQPPQIDRPLSAMSPGVVIYSAQNISAAELTRLLQPLAGSSAQVRSDASREQVFLSGDPTTVNALLRTAKMFDVDWLKGLNFQFFPLSHATPAELTAQLRRIFGGKEGPVGSQVDFIEVDRLGAIIAISKRSAQLAEVASWIERLDQPSARPARSFRVIPLTNLVANDFVKTLSQLLSDQDFSTSTTGSKSRSSTSTSSPTSSAFSSSNSLANATPATAPQAEGNANRGVAGLVDGLRVTADSQSNALVLFANDSEFQDVRNIVRELDVAPAQVLIEATVAEVTLNDQLKFGVQFFIEQKNGLSGGFTTGSDSTTPSAFPGLSIGYVKDNYHAVLNALSAVTDVQLVSTPQILVLSNQTAKLQVGDQVPIINQSAASTLTGGTIINSVEYRDTGVVLSVTPRVGDHGRMFIDIDQQVSEVAGTTSSNIDSPTIQQRQFSTHIQVDDGQVIALGGLMRTQRTIGDTRIPLLGEAPLVGPLFRSRDRTTRQTELVVFLRPTIIRSRSDAERVTDELAGRLQALGLRREAAP